MKSTFTDIQQELERISPLVGKKLIERPNYEVPDGYFDQLEEILMSQFTISEVTKEPNFDVTESYFSSNETKWMPASKNVVKRNVVWMVAASISILLLAISFLKWPSSEIEITDEMAWMYIEENIYQIDTEDLIQYGLIDEDGLESFESDEIDSSEQIETSSLLEEEIF
ncbi:MAG: hypothetical protein WAT79_12680 [Saprospiraceae bacterium]